MRARVIITPREKRRHTTGREKNEPRLAFLAWGDFHARSRFARSIYYPEEKWWTTRSEILHVRRLSAGSGSRVRARNMAQAQDEIIGTTA